MTKRFAYKRDHDYMGFIHDQVCFLKGLHDCFGKLEAMHLITRGAAAWDYANVVPACQRAHALQGKIGIDSWTLECIENFSVNPWEDAVRLFQCWMDLQQSDAMREEAQLKRAKGLLESVHPMFTGLIRQKIAEFLDESGWPDPSVFAGRTDDERWRSVGEGKPGVLSEETLKAAIKAVLEAKTESWYGVWNEDGEFVRIVRVND